jgi:hypothetical protein
VSTDQPGLTGADGSALEPAERRQPAGVAKPASAHAGRKKHHARIEHKIRGRIRMKVPHANLDPEILEHYRNAFSAIPGIRSVSTKPESGSIVIHYDPNRQGEFEHHFDDACSEHLTMAPLARPDDEIDKIANEIAAEAEFLAAHSTIARATVDFCKNLDRELKLATGNTIDLKIVLAGGLAAFTFLEIGGNAATPMWVTLVLFSLNHFAELHADHLAERPPTKAQV